MAKISTYPSDSNVTLSDKLIGTDVENNNATKNFTVGDLLDLIPIEDYVPYTGATANVNLGSFDIQATDGLFTNITVVNGNITNASVTNLQCIDGSFNNSLGIEANAELLLDGDQGSSGEILISQGVGQNPIWQSQSTLFSNLVPYTGATANVNLGSFTIQALLGLFSTVNSYNGIFYDLNITGPLRLSNDVGISGQVLTSQGPGVDPLWTSLPVVSYASYYSTATQQHTALSTPLAVDFPTVSETLGVYVTASNKIGFNNLGLYIVQLIARVEHTSGGGDAELNFWLKDQSANIANSRQVFTIANTHKNEITYTFMLRVTNTANEYNVMWSTTNLAAKLIPTVAGGIYPAAPSAILNINKIG